ncbi:MAG: hypothetical protein O2865_06540 [Planctomycetota bacterium]|nr:hypothetical protein [Planctomycetota bacterium]MDA0934382.1 hypothetical protein [Planctomycetota bacterium]MDA1222825.1 hypothetical protein [Planctomycetota bacterium]
MFSTSLRALWMASAIALLAVGAAPRAQFAATAAREAAPIGDLAPVHEVVGRVELESAEAELAVRIAADDWARRHMARRGAAVEAGRTGLPQVLEVLVRESWLRDLEVGRLYEVVGRETDAREHRGYRSYQSTWRLVPQELAMGQAADSLVVELERAGRRFWGVVAATPLFWGLLALAHGWFDRITRGYMPWRGRVACVLMAIFAPAGALVWGCL